MSGPRTEAGRRLLAEEWDNFDAKPWGSLADHVDAIEDQAAATERARIAGLVEALPWESLLRHQNGDDTVSRAAVLAAIEGESK